MDVVIESGSVAGRAWEADRGRAARGTVVRDGAAPRSSGRLRLTRRGRIVFAVLGLAIVFGAVRGGQAVADGPAAPQVVDVHVVSAGETVWDLARSVATDGQDVRDVVAQILRLNNLPSADIAVGQRVLLPSDD